MLRHLDGKSVLNLIFLWPFPYVGILYLSCTWTHTKISSHERSHRLSIYTEWVWSVGPRQFLKGVAADRGYYYRGVIRGRRELSGAFPDFLRLSLRLLIRQRKASERDVRGSMRRGCLFFLTPQDREVRTDLDDIHATQALFPPVWRWVIPTVDKKISSGNGWERTWIDLPEGSWRNF